MKRFLLFAAIAALSPLLVLSCAQKYEPVGPFGGSPGSNDTVYDTLIIHDTVVVTDTLPPDTVIIIDTVIVKNPKDSSCQWCGTIEGSTHSITWSLYRPSGTYSLEFTATTERDQPPQSVTVSMAEQQTTWDVSSQPILNLTKTFNGWKTITITSNVPPAYGHGITICLRVKRD